MTLLLNGFSLIKPAETDKHLDSYLDSCQRGFVLLLSSLELFSLSTQQ